MTQTITIKQHKQAVALGIKQRHDGMWGYKRKCAYVECSERLDACFAADTFEEAVTNTTERSHVYHSDRCYILSGGAAAFMDALEETPGPYDDDDQISHADMVRKVKARNADLTPLEQMAFAAWAEPYYVEEFGDDEADCEIDGDD